MPKIHVLQPYIANQIAAGEVVERPASVVKELVENALDAHATAITVEIEGGGISYIRVTDNGDGIPAEECALAFLRHATSKINERDDLEHIETLGFRGEALASIAAVSRVELKSRQDNGDGMRVRVEGGDKKIVQPAGCPKGTTITVESLFYNVPARRKFLKSARSETGYIGDYISRMMLARPDVSFKYINQQKNIYHSLGDGNLRNVIFSVYGQEVLDYLREVNYDDGYICLSGFVGAPEIARPNRSHQSFFLNGRYIQSAHISNALVRPYDTLLMGKKYPFAVLALTISSREVDVNVHPTKLEARFAQETRVLESVSRACAAALNVKHIPDARFVKKDSPEEKILDAEVTQTAEASSAYREYHGVPDEKGAAGISARAFTPLADAPALSFRVKESEFTIPQYKIEHVEQVPLNVADTGNEASAPLDAEQQAFGSLPVKIIGQAFDTYWFLQHGESLYIIDQHAAHERMLYERFMAGAERSEAQALLIPELISLTGTEYGVFSQYYDELRAIGFEIEDFGASSVRVFAIPTALVGGNVADTLRDALDGIRKRGATSTKELRREAIVQAACKHAIKAGDPLAEEAMLEILDYFINSGTPMTCPHGRPIIIRLERKELEKLFKRIV